MYRTAEFPEALVDLSRWWETTDRMDTNLDRQFARLADAGVLGWVIPVDYGGSEISALELNEGYVRLAEACLPTTFVLTQRNGACQRIARSEQVKIKSELLPALGAGTRFATVGISHLTTSRQHVEPVVRARRMGDVWRIDGTVPWVTAGAMADELVVGATCGDGREVLVIVSTDSTGVEVLEPPPLMALNASSTGAVRLSSVNVTAERVIAGPVNHVMKSGVGAGTGSVTTSALALGLSARALKGLRDEATGRADLEPIVESFAGEWDETMGMMRDSLTQPTDVAPTASAVRERANSLVLRITQALLAACKGRGFVQGQQAERLVREAMFFLVWSCPQPVLSAALQELACRHEGGWGEHSLQEIRD